MGRSMNTFIAQAEVVAEKEIKTLEQTLAKKFSGIIRFLSENPDYASGAKGKNAPIIGSEEYIRAMAQGFSNSRQPKPPSAPTTVPDDVVGEILHFYFDIPRNKLDDIKREHQLSMASENMVGNILEHYLASVLEEHGWIWCSGSMVKAVDFIKPLPKNEGWRMLQVKNRDNSENSSSSAIRNGTSIEKWHRTFSRKQGSNWENFPDQDTCHLLSEEAFRVFVAEYLKGLKR